MQIKMGLLMLDTNFKRIPGDIGNDATFNFPVCKKIVYGATADLVVKDNSLKLLQPFILACQELEREGVSFITTSCGFLSKFQKELSNCVNIPVYTSSLLQIPYVNSILNDEQVVGVLTIRKCSLTNNHFKGASCELIPKIIYGMEGTYFEHIFMDNPCEYNEAKLQDDILSISSQMIKENENIGALVCECTNMPPFTKIISDKFNIPVFDINTLINKVYLGLVYKNIT